MCLCSYFVRVIKSTSHHYIIGNYSICHDCPPTTFLFSVSGFKDITSTNPSLAFIWPHYGTAIMHINDIPWDLEFKFSISYFQLFYCVLFSGSLQFCVSQLQIIVEKQHNCFLRLTELDSLWLNFEIFFWNCFIYFVITPFD